VKIYLCNDTFKGHSGSKAVMNSLRKLLSHHEIIGVHEYIAKDFNADLIKKSDAVVVNGEGTIHHNRGEVLIDILRYAQAVDKKTYLINSVIDVDKMLHPDVFRKLDYFSVREDLSQAKARAYTLTNPKVVLDLCLLSPKGSQTIDYKDEMVKIGTHPEAFMNLDSYEIPEVKLDTSFGDIVENLKTAHLCITGRHHGVYACAMAGIPFVPVSGNCHKIEGLISTVNQMFDTPIKTCRTKKEVEEGIQFALNNRKVFEHFARYLHFAREEVNREYTEVFK
jgi:hypothetical protein